MLPREACRMSRPRLLDLFACAGGAGVGYQRAGFDVTGVELDPDRAAHYPLPVFVADALEYLEQHGHEYDAIHASPPCQASTALTKGNRARGGIWEDLANAHVDLIPETRQLLDSIGTPYVIENVQGATMRRDLTLCGEMFGLGVIRHRYFELGGWSMDAPAHVPHRGRVAGWRHGEWFDGPYFAVYGDGGGKGSIEQWKNAMGIDWMTERVLLAEAIPPAYTQHVGTQLMNHLALSHMSV
jgi:site-specific DNA-cytosine methylase